MNSTTSSSIIKSLIDVHGLIPHPEGGFYIESFRSSQMVTTSNGSLRYKVCTKTITL